MRVAIVGAGIAGLSCGEALLAAGVDVHWFEKSRATAGRASAKRAWSGHVDMGAQYFTARQLSFQEQVADWQQQGLVAVWDAVVYRYENGLLHTSADDSVRYVGTEAMHSPWRAGLEHHRFSMNCRICEVSYQDGWQLLDEAGNRYDDFDALILAVPPAQAESLLAHDDELCKQLPTSMLQPCQSIALQLANAIDHDATAVFVKGGPVSWLARQDTKPGRGNAKQQWVVHFTPAYSQRHVNATLAELSTTAIHELQVLFNQSIIVDDSVHHRWLYAIVDSTQPAPGVLISKRYPCVVTGDWCLGGRVENAWLAGRQAAKAVHSV